MTHVTEKAKTTMLLFSHGGSNMAKFAAMLDLSLTDAIVVTNISTLLDQCELNSVAAVIVDSSVPKHEQARALAAIRFNRRFPRTAIIRTTSDRFDLGTSEGSPYDLVVQVDDAPSNVRRLVYMSILRRQVLSEMPIEARIDQPFTPNHSSTSVAA